jgi:hypothetical protein
VELFLHQLVACEALNLTIGNVDHERQAVWGSAGGVLNRKGRLCLENPSRKLALYMHRLSKRWQLSELPRLHDRVYATPTLINPCVFR